jgi:hypothetical protein
MFILALDRPAESDIATVEAHVTAPPSLISPEEPKEMFLFIPNLFPVTFS